MGRTRERVGLALGVALVVVAGLALVAYVRPAIQRQQVQILAHRGASAYAPENTLSAFKLAAEQGAEWLDLEVQQTRDGRLVAFHDLRLERTTNGRGLLRETSLAELQALDAGSWFDAQFGAERVPTFDEVMTLAKASGLRLFVEMKEPRHSPGIEERMAAALSVFEFEDRTVVQSFDEKSLDRLRALNPRLRLALRYGRDNPQPGDVRGGIAVLGPEWTLVQRDPALVREAHALGLQVVVWTVDTPESIRQAIGARVDGIITSRPDAARRILDGG
jgi:glycerophosphoryl diester phosphodiesterase